MLVPEATPVEPEADAFTLAKIGQALVQGVELTKFQEEVIKKLKGE